MAMYSRMGSIQDLGNFVMSGLLGHAVLRSPVDSRWGEIRFPLSAMKQPRRLRHRPSHYSPVGHVQVSRLRGYLIST